MSRPRKSGLLLPAGPEAEPLRLRMPVNWRPRPYQIDLWEGLLDGVTRADIVAVQTHAAEHALQDQLTTGRRASK